MNEVVNQTMRQAVADGIFPSAQLIIVKGKEPIFHEAFGNATLDTIFDIASLTKAICTTTLTMQLVAENKLQLNDPIKKYLPEVSNNSIKEITFRHLLSHSSGLPAWQPYYQMVPKDDIGKPEGKEEILTAIFNEPLSYEPGHRSLYSDLGFILLGLIIERITRKRLNELFNEKIAKPLGLENTFFVPLNLSTKAPKRLSTAFAPTEDCPWRHKILQGEVHDQNCYAMGGVAGHAGLFSTTTDIEKFVKAFKNNFIPKEIIDKFLPFGSNLTEVNSTWYLGWDRPSHLVNPLVPASPRTIGQSGIHFSEKSFGHLGYTGCSLWIDLKQDFWVCLLTNRIHPSTTNEKIRQFRPMLHNMIYEEVIAK